MPIIWSGSALNDYLACMSIRSGLNHIHGRAGSHFCVGQGERSVVDRVSMSDERRGESQKGPRLFGLRSKIGADCVAALENTTSNALRPAPCHHRF